MLYYKSMPSSDLSITKEELEHTKDILKSITHDGFIAATKDLEKINIDVLKIGIEDKYDREL
jgi:hypothetical protein